MKEEGTNMLSVSYSRTCRGVYTAPQWSVSVVTEGVSVFVTCEGMSRGNGVATLHSNRTAEQINKVAAQYLWH